MPTAMGKEQEKSLDQAVSFALRYLSYRPRSEFEVRGRLRRTYHEQVVELAVARLKELDLLDDRAFAHAWSLGRAAHKPRSAALVRRELLAKGVDREIAQASVDTLDDWESAYKAGLRAASSSSLRAADYTTFRSRVWGRLHRRGFSAAIVRGVVARLWEERCAEPERERPSGS